MDCRIFYSHLSTAQQLVSYQCCNPNLALNGFRDVKDLNHMVQVNEAGHVWHLGAHGALPFSSSVLSLEMRWELDTVNIRVDTFFPAGLMKGRLLAEALNLHSLALMLLVCTCRVQEISKLKYRVAPALPQVTQPDGDRARLGAPGPSWAVALQTSSLSRLLSCIGPTKRVSSCLPSSLSPPPPPLCTNTCNSASAHLQNGVCPAPSVTPSSPEGYETRVNFFPWCCTDRKRWCEGSRGAENCQ